MAEVEGMFSLTEQKCGDTMAEAEGMFSLTEQKCGDSMAEVEGMFSLTQVVWPWTRGSNCVRARDGERRMTINFGTRNPIPEDHFFFSFFFSDLKTRARVFIHVFRSLPVSLCVLSLIHI